MPELASFQNLALQIPTMLGGATNAEIPAAVASPEFAWAGFILLLPALSAVLCGVCAMLGVRNKLPGAITAVALLAAFATTLSLFLKMPQDAPRTVHLFDWVAFAWTGEGASFTSFLAPFALYIDSLTLLWMLFVTGLGSLIAIYATEYMEADVGKGYARFFGSVSIFLFAMGSLVMGGNLILLYLGWEGVGLASYLLIGYFYSRPSAVAAAKKAFIMNRIGDLGLALGVFLIWVNYGTVEYGPLFAAVSSGEALAGEGSAWSASLIPYCLMLGAFGKSAQIPLFVWLPDAMEGPTPVSALIHAATMVTAGIYLIARTYPLFLLDPNALTVVAVIGCATAFVAATIGMAQYDIKRVMAYSTVSQLGYMFLGLGVGTSFGAVYHVFTHAFFKALLFLCCGAIMHGMAGQLDLRKMSGLRNVKGFGVISWTFLIGCLCLAGFPFTAGFFSKDSIIAQAFASGNPTFVVLGWLALFTAFLTAYYTFRVWFRVCGGPTKYEPGDELHGHGDDHAHGDHGHDGHGHDGHGHDAHGHGGNGHADAHGWHPHGPRLAINGVLLLICAGALLAAVPSYLGEMQHKTNWVESMVSHSSAAVGIPAHDHGGDAHAHHALSFTGIADVHKATSVVASVVGIVGILIALYFHLLNRGAADRLRAALLSNGLTRRLPLALENKWYIDEIYHWVFRFVAWVLGHIFHVFDKQFIDGVLVNGTARIPMEIGRVFQPLYNGALQGYAATMAGGIALIALWVMWIWLGGM
ncbi:MAG: NADH-quinone oxidoreductase subunit [Planctomycetota bacterium]|jgi:NADH-quinone oxidoreductase subunit L